MKKLLLLIGILMAFGVQAQAFLGLGNRLADGCRDYALKRDMDAYATCLDDVSAVANIMAYAANHNLRACIPPASVVNGQVTAVLDKAFREHAEQFQFSALSLVAASLSQAFPCKT